jgi:hypothetical protein
MLLASPAPASSQCDEACGIFNDPDTGEEIAWAVVVQPVSDFSEA